MISPCLLFVTEVKITVAFPNKSTQFFMSGIARISFDQSINFSIVDAKFESFVFPPSKYYRLGAFSLRQFGDSFEKHLTSHSFYSFACLRPARNDIEYTGVASCGIG